MLIIFCVLTRIFLFICKQTNWILVATRPDSFLEKSSHTEEKVVGYYCDFCRGMLYMVTCCCATEVEGKHIGCWDVDYVSCAGSTQWPPPFPSPSLSTLSFLFLFTLLQALAHWSTKTWNGLQRERAHGGVFSISKKKPRSPSISRSHTYTISIVKEFLGSSMDLWLLNSHVTDDR